MKYPSPTAWGSLWWQNEQKAWFEVRTGVTPRHAEDDTQQRITLGFKPLLFLPLGKKPTPDARTWASYGPPDP